MAWRYSLTASKKTSARTGGHQGDFVRGERQSKGYRHRGCVGSSSRPLEALPGRKIEKAGGSKSVFRVMVKVLKNWRKDEDVLKRLGYSVPKKGK